MSNPFIAKFLVDIGQQDYAESGALKNISQQVELVYTGAVTAKELQDMVLDAASAMLKAIVLGSNNDMACHIHRWAEIDVEFGKDVISHQFGWQFFAVAEFSVADLQQPVSWDI